MPCSSRTQRGSWRAVAYSHTCKQTQNRAAPTKQGGMLLPIAQLPQGIAARPWALPPAQEPLANRQQGPAVPACRDKTNEACVQLPREGPPQSSAQARNSSPPCPLALQHAWGRSGWQRQLGKAKRPRRVTEPEPFPLCCPARLRPRKAEGPLHAGSKQQGQCSLLPPADLLGGSPWGTRTGPCSDVPDKSPTGTEQNRCQCVLGAPSAPAPCGG